MEGTDLFLSLAEIAGVFVGFGALIAARSGAAMDVTEINSIRWVLTTGIWVVIVALAPVIVSSYGLSGHGLWLGCSLLAFALLAGMILVYGRSSENRADIAKTVASQSLPEIALWAAPVFWLPVAVLVGALALVALGPAPGQEKSLYLTAVAMGLLMSALGLFATVFLPRSPASR